MDSVSWANTTKIASMVTIQLAIFMLWCSASYKMGILGFVLYITILVHTIRHDDSVSKSRYVLFIAFGVLLLEYLSACLSLSSLNSPREFPLMLQTNSSGVIGNPGTYPSDKQYYMDIPIYWLGSGSLNSAKLEWFSLLVGNR